MSLEKSRLKMLIAENIGRELEEARDKAGRDIYRHQGAASALNKAEEALNKLTQKLKDEFIQSDAELPFDPTNKIEVGKFIVEQIMKGTSEIHNLADISGQSAIRAEGIKLGYEASVKTVFKTYEDEKNKLDALAAAIEAGKIRKDGDELVLVEDVDDPKAPRPPGAHPGPPLKAKREAEGAKSAEEFVPVKEPPKKKRTPKKKAPSKKAAKPRKRANASNA